MAIYRIKITLANGARCKHTSAFPDGGEAMQQTLADYPQARAVSAMFIVRLS